MRNAALLIVILAVGACSLDHVVVAALDDAGSTNPGAVLGLAGGSGLNASAAGSGTSGGSPDQGGTDRFLIGLGGSSVNVQIGADTDAGVTSVLLCSCGAQPTGLCGSDGITYPPSCDDGGTCILPEIACFHACPCLAGESASAEVTSWFSPNCVLATQCAGDAFCLGFSNVTPNPQNCADAGI